MKLSTAFACAAFSLFTALARAAPFAYVPTDAGTVNVIDTATNTVTATIPVGNGPVGVSVNPAGTKVYTTNDVDDTVSVIDTATNTVTATIHVGTTPDFIAVHPTLPVAYASNHDGDNVSVINTNTNLVTATIPVGLLPAGVVVHPAGTFAYVANNGNSNTVSVIDTATNTVVANIPAGGAPGSGPYGIAINRAGTRLYTARPGGGTLVVIDTTTNTVIATIGVGTTPTNVAINPSGSRVYVSNSASNNVSVIDTASNTVIATVGVGPHPLGIGVDPSGTFIYVANNGSNKMSVIDALTNTVTTTVTVDMGPEAQGLFFGPGGISNHPLIITKASATFTVGVPASFQVVATGTPTPTLTEIGTLPTGITFTAAPAVSTDHSAMDSRALPNGTVTGTLSGTPAPGTAGDYQITFVASNGIPPDATQSFTLTVDPVADIPMLGPWALVLLTILLGGMGGYALWRQSPG